MIRIVAALATMREDQTLVMQSGKPIGLFSGQATTPLVIMANGNIVGEVRPVAFIPNRLETIRAYPVNPDTHYI